MDHVQSLYHDDVSHYKKLIALVKPGIIFGNIITLSGGYFLAGDTLFSWSVFLSALLGMAFVIGSGCVLNNYIDRDIDRLMRRTQKRPSACGLVSLRFALIYALILGIVGFSLLYVGTNLLTVLIAFIGLFTYVVAYSLWFKRSSRFGTIIGAISGAVPPVIGYTAVADQFNSVAIILFIILFCWQMPHFYAIAIYRRKDYEAAAIPVLPLCRSIWYTKVNMLFFVVLYVTATLLLNVIGIAGNLYFIVALLTGSIWILMSIRGFYTINTAKWARRMFLFSVFNITLLSVTMIFRV